jgi:hypothetical protein
MDLSPLLLFLLGVGFGRMGKDDSSSKAQGPGDTYHLFFVLGFLWAFF